MAYQVTDFSGQLDPFEFILPGEEQPRQIKSYNLLSTLEINRIASAARRDDLGALIAALADGDADLMDKLWALPLRAVTDLYAAWQREAGISQGEQKAS